MDFFLLKNGNTALMIYEGVYLVYTQPIFFLYRIYFFVFVVSNIDAHFPNQEQNIHKRNNENRSVLTWLLFWSFHFNIKQVFVG